MATYRVEIPDWLPASVNDLLRMHWSLRRRVLRGEAQLVALYARQAGVPDAPGKRKVTLAFAAPGGRGAKTGDPDARLKGTLDALVKCGALRDDSPAWCSVAVECRKGKKQTVITLEDL